MRRLILSTITATTLMFLISCKGNVKDAEQNNDQTTVEVKTIAIAEGSIENMIVLNGKTIYLKKNTIVSPIVGYITKVNVKFGDEVKKNEVLFEVQTKESKALENTKEFTGSAGIIKVTAPSDGVISELLVNGTGIFVSEGSSLCTIVENHSLMVQANVPYQYNFILKTGTKCKMLLSDNTTIDGFVSQILPTINETDQTQNVLIKPITNKQLPGNLNLTIQFVNEKHSRSCLVPKEALMTNETQTEFWIMKIRNNNMAVKIPVLKGIDNDSVVEIISPLISVGDEVIIDGAYGLPDSAAVKIIK